MKDEEIRQEKNRLRKEIKERIKRLSLNTVKKRTDRFWNR